MLLLYAVMEKKARRKGKKEKGKGARPLPLAGGLCRSVCSQPGDPSGARYLGAARKYYNVLLFDDGL